MMHWWSRSTGWSVAAFAAVSLLVIGGLGWVTLAAIGLEREQARGAADAEFRARRNLAMWRLDSAVAGLLARESARPPEQYHAVFAPRAVLPPDELGTAAPAAVLEPSPLLTEVPPEWAMLYFHVSAGSEWSTPQLMPAGLESRMRRVGIEAADKERRARLLADLAGDVTFDELIDQLPQPGQMQQRLEVLMCPSDPTSDPGQMALRPEANEVADRSLRQSQQLYNQQWVQREAAPAEIAGRELRYLCCDVHNRVYQANSPVDQSSLRFALLVPVQFACRDGHSHMAFARRVDLATGPVVQGVLLHWELLRERLAAQVREDLFPDAEIRLESDPTAAAPETLMANLPASLVVAPPPLAEVTGWTTLRVGLALAWLAALVALTAVGFGGWTLLELSERRNQFVAAVTHELRTPLTTLRLYLDMLSSGMVRDETQRAEYLRTLSGEADRLSGLVGNVLDYARLENGRPPVERRAVAIAEFLHEAGTMLAPRCQAAGKTLVVEDETAPGSEFHTDAELARQIVSNLVENACKHTADAADGRIWLRAAPDSDGWIRINVEDRGPGIAPSDRRRVFEPFCRGSATSAAPAPGVGLGLALAGRWARLLGGSLRIANVASGERGTRLVLMLPSGK